MKRGYPPGVQVDEYTSRPTGSSQVPAPPGTDYWAAHANEWCRGREMAQAYPEYRTPYYPYQSQDSQSHTWQQPPPHPPPGASQDSHLWQQPPPPLPGASLVVDKDPRNPERLLRNTPGGEEFKQKNVPQGRMIQNDNVPEWRNGPPASFTPGTSSTPPQLPPPETKLETKKPETAPPPLKPVILVGKRRGGRVLPTGNLGVTKKPKTENEKGRSDAWSRYMAEVSKYKERSCEEDRKNRPLVK